MARRSDFRGETAKYYARYRRGYPAAVVDAIIEHFALTFDDVVVDLGCGTGQLTVPLADRVAAVIGMDPEPDMLTAAPRHPDVLWTIGADSDLPVLGRALKPLGAVTIATAIHWMDRDRLFGQARPLFRTGGGIVVVTNGLPLWMHDAEWSRELRAGLAEWSGRQSGTCQTDAAGRTLTRTALERAGFSVTEKTVEYRAPLELDDIIGGILSASNPNGDDRTALAAIVERRLAGHLPITENVAVHLQFGLIPS